MEKLVTSARMDTLTFEINNIKQDKFTNPFAHCAKRDARVLISMCAESIYTRGD